MIFNNIFTCNLCGDEIELPQDFGSGVLNIIVNGQEKYEYFPSSITRGQTLCKYTYKEINREFSCVKRSPAQCRYACKRWLINEALKARQKEILLAMKDTEIDSDRMCNLSGELDEIAGQMDGVASTDELNLTVFSVDRQ